MSTSIATVTTGLVPSNLDEALRLAEFMARANTLPKHLQRSPGDCLMIVEQAMRWGMSPWAVAQATSVISGKMMFEGKLVAAAVETSGAIVGQLDYTFTGAGDTRAIEVSATRRGETNPRTVTVTLKEARTENQMWKRQPDQQLVYHGARVWARRWTPAVILGVYAREEMGAIIEGEIVEPDPLPEPTPASEPAVEAVRPKSKQTPDEYLDALAAELANASTAEVDEILARPSVQAAQDRARGAHKDRLQHILDEAIARTAAEVEAGDGLYANPAEDPFRQPVTAS